MGDSTAPLRVLIVGAGTVGQVYGHHAALGGATVGVLVKEQHVEEARRGYPIHRLGLWGKPSTARFQPAHVHTLQTLAGTGWDLIILCTSSAALHTSLPADLAPHVGNATVLVLQPGLEDRALVTQHVPDAQVLLGLISLVAYHSPLPGESLPPGTAVFLPPLNPCLVSGPTQARVNAVVGLLDRGGLPTAAHPNVAAAVAAPGAMLNVFVRVLEKAGWKLSQLAAPQHRELLGRAISQAVAINCARAGTPVPRAVSLLRPGVLLGALGVARRLAPFPLEVYLQVHFSKVGQQTVLLLTEQVAQGKQLHLPVDALEALVAAS